MMARRITSLRLPHQIFLVLLLLVGMPRPGLSSSAGNSADQQEGALVTNVFYETDLREVLLNISDQTGVPIVADQSVRGSLTMVIREMPLEECLRRVLEPFGYTFRYMDKYYLVGSADPKSPSFPMLSVTESVAPSYLKAVEVQKLISDFYRPYVRADAQTNRLTITASPEIVARFKQDLKAIDVAYKQVMIEALVTEISDESLKEFGIDGSIDGAKDGRTRSVSMPLDGEGEQSIGVVGTKLGDVWSGWTVDYEVALRALLTEGKANIRANPRLVTAEGQTAKIFIGKDQYYTISTGTEPYYYSRLEVIKVGITLEITPYVSAAGEITVDLISTVSDVTGMGATGLPVINTRDVRTRITVQNGESLVIGGLQLDDERKSVKKVPLLGDIPLLGLLFRSTKTEIRKSQIVIMVTPRILEEKPNPDALGG